jgi:hypothetical protein
VTVTRLFVGIVLLQTVHWSFPAPARSEDHHITVTVSLADSLLHAGDTSAIIIRFTPDDGFHVNAVPPPEIELHPGVVQPADSSVDLVSKEPDILDAAIPVRQFIVVSFHATPHRLFLRGTLRYYFCSDRDGWCARRSLEFALPLTVTQ